MPVDPIEEDLHELHPEGDHDESIAEEFVDMVEATAAWTNTRNAMAQEMWQNYVNPMNKSRMLEFPYCKCGAGRMRLLTAGEGSAHPGRVYYKCPKKLNHAESFFWCDDYHRNDPDTPLPEFVINQTWKPSSAASTSYGSSSRREITREMERSTNVHHGPNQVVDEAMRLLFVALYFIMGYLVGKYF